MTLALGGSPPQTLSPLIKKENDAFRNKCIIRLLIATCIGVFLLFLIPVLAAVEDPHTYKLGEESWDTGELKNGLNACAFTMVYYTYGAFPELVSTSGVLSIDIKATYMETFNNFYNSTAAIGMGLAVIWVMLDLIEKAQMDQMTPEVLIRWCIKLVTAIIVVDNADTFAKSLIDVGNELITSDDVNFASANATLITNFFNTLKTASWYKTISIMIECLIPAIAMMFCMIMMLVQLFGRILEIGIRFGFMPIGVSDAFTHGLNSAGMRYIKKFFAVCLQGAALYMIMVAGAALMGQVSLGGEGFAFLSNFGILSQLVIAFSMVGLMLKSQQIINDIAGV